MTSLIVLGVLSVGALLLIVPEAIEAFFKNVVRRKRKRDLIQYYELTRNYRSRD